MSTRLYILTSALCLPAAWLAAQDKPADQSGKPPADERLERLVGEYEIVEGAKDGAKIPAERLKNNTVAITRDTIAVVDPDRKELYSARFKLGPANDEGVAQINMRSKSPKEGANAVGLLKRDGDQLWLIYDVNNKRPENFERTTVGQHLFKMKRKQATKPTPTE
ncbi:MAG: TIGR03067 domain-containing protein [Planctomycetaceae bacterium]